MQLSAEFANPIKNVIKKSFKVLSRNVCEGFMHREVFLSLFIRKHNAIQKKIVKKVSNAKNCAVFCSRADKIGNEWGSE